LVWQQYKLQVQSRGRGTYDLTEQVRARLHDSNVTIGLAHLFIQHTSASLIICENADPAVRDDLEAFMARVVPDGDPMFSHVDEGPDDMPAHVRTVLTSNSVTLPISGGQLALGTWQGVYLWEHRRRPHKRTVTLTIQGDRER
jgi:secondary thiamine-phosphate synthase enzyme